MLCLHLYFLSSTNPTYFPTRNFFPFLLCLVPNPLQHRLLLTFSPFCGFVFWSSVISLDKDICLKEGRAGSPLCNLTAISLAVIRWFIITVCASTPAATFPIDYLTFSNVFEFGIISANFNNTLFESSMFIL